MSQLDYPLYKKISWDASKPIKKQLSEVLLPVNEEFFVNEHSFKEVLEKCFLTQFPSCFWTRTLYRNQVPNVFPPKNELDWIHWKLKN